ncbi:MAG: aldo/keto reductase [Bacteroidaceae bacterium]|nr:aldo/keto reductase [Bacteroidaceae bacterium]
MKRRDFLKTFGAVVGTAAVGSQLAGCGSSNEGDNIQNDDYNNQKEPPKGKMTYRTKDKAAGERGQTSSLDLPSGSRLGEAKVSILGYGMMRLPMIDAEGDKTVSTIDQDGVNRLVDYAIEHGVNYYDTSPVYCQGLSERSTGIALSRHPRSSYYVATKLSNFSEEAWSREASIAMYHKSMKELQVDYIDYYLLHAVGGGGMDNFRKRYIDNNIIDYLLEERKAGRIRNLGFSFHGDVEVYDWLLANHDKYHWDFVQIQMNYVDWYPNYQPNERNISAYYLYNELEKRGIPAVIMEPLLGGRLAKLPKFVLKKLKERDPQKSAASWAFRYAGTPKNVLTVLSGMTYMEHLKDNLLSYCPLKPLTDEEMNFLYDIAEDIRGVQTIPCTACSYCMPCPYGIDIPGIFTHYNKCLNEGVMPVNPNASEYARLRRNYLIGLARSVEPERQPDHCIGCGKCEQACPQNIRIPREMRKIDDFINKLKS